MRDLRWAIASLVVGTTLLSGCSEKVEANDTLPNPSASPSTEALPPLGPPDLPMPDDARTHDAAGVESFVRYYFDLLNRSLRDMDTQYLRAFADPACDVCERIASETEDDAGQGYSYDGGELTIPGEMSVAMESANEAQTGFTAVQAPMTVLDDAGKPVPELVFDGNAALSSGTITVWDEATHSWKMTELTLG